MEGWNWNWNRNRVGGVQGIRGRAAIAHQPMGRGRCWTMGIVTPTPVRTAGLATADPSRREKSKRGRRGVGQQRDRLAQGQLRGVLELRAAALNLTQLWVGAFYSTVDTLGMS